MILPPITLAVLVVLGLGSPLWTQTSQIADWSSWAGPNGDFSVDLPEGQLPLSKPRLVWERSIGVGHSAAVVQREHCFSQFSTGLEECIQKLDMRNGRLIWEVTYPVIYESKRYPGPHATPAVADGKLVAASIDGTIRALDVGSGKILWQVDLIKDLGTTLPQSGYASSPLIVGDLVIVPGLGKAQARETEYFQTPGDADPPGAIAFDLVNGRIRWKSKSFRSSHASPLQINVDGDAQVCIHGMFELVGLEPSSGELLWRHRLRDIAADNVAFTPIWDVENRQLILSHGYCDKGAQAVGLSNQNGFWETKLNWNNRAMRIEFTNAVIASDRFVGVSGDSTNVIMGLDRKNGEAVFRNRWLTNSNFIRLGKALLASDTSGVLRYGRVTQDGFVQTWQMDTGAGKSWAIPTWSDRQLLLRSDSKLQLYAFE